jgi:hypothetical protein
VLNLSFAQDSTFLFTKDGFTDFVVTPVDGKNKSVLYNKALDWISVTYKNPNVVIKAKIENEYIRFEGSNNNMLCIKTLGIKNCELANYQIEVSFKDGKYKFDLIEVKEYAKPSQYGSGGWNTVLLPTPEEVKIKPSIMDHYFNDEGEPRKLQRFYVENIPAEFNALNQSLRQFLLSDKIPSQQADW